ncbi:MAG: 16S rRNA (cytidine(1402)-2'-O)-methyltransferase [Actinobacteria bacterium]|nr:16S rRNA (cytidine(1402)-2'-O)-methyltransferase [Actinomycetota bacterium]
MLMEKDDKNKCSGSGSGATDGTGSSRTGTLYVCSTPIGNLEDVSFRLKRILEEADIIAAEDTRTTLGLLARYSIRKKKLISYHDHSGKTRIQKIMESLREGCNVALVSESGTPSIQDPGYSLITACIENGLSVTVVPGPNAAISALVLSGLPADNFFFAGFLPRSAAKRKSKLAELSRLSCTMIFYESPNRIKKLLAEVLEIMGSRKAALARELTKVFEEVIRGKVQDILAGINDRTVKGEIVLVVEGSSAGTDAGTGDGASLTEKEIKEELALLVRNGMTKKEALKDMRARYDIDRQKLYNISTKIRVKEGEKERNND